MIQGFCLSLVLALDFEVQTEWLKRVCFLIQYGRKCLEKQKRSITGKFQDNICYIVLSRNMESFRFEKTFKIIESNHKLSTAKRSVIVMDNHQGPETLKKQW